MDINKKAIEAIIDGSEYMIDEKIRKAPYDKTKKCRIIKDNGNKTYDIILDGVEYKNIKTQGGECRVNDIVNVVVPLNNYNSIYIDRETTTWENIDEKPHGLDKDADGNIVIEGDVRIISNISTQAKRSTSYITTDTELENSKAIMSSTVLDLESSNIANSSISLTTESDTGVVDISAVTDTPFHYANIHITSNGISSTVNEGDMTTNMFKIGTNYSQSDTNITNSADVSKIKKYSIEPFLYSDLINSIQIKEFSKIYTDDIVVGIVGQDVVTNEYSRYFLKGVDGNYSIDYQNINCALIKYCQELEARITALENK